MIYNFEVSYSNEETADVVISASTPRAAWEAVLKSEELWEEPGHPVCIGLTSVHE